MVVKITQGKNVGGMLQYNNRKVKEGEAVILAYNKIATGGKDIQKLGVTGTKESFERMGNLKPNLKNKYIHISLNPNPDDKLSDEQLASISKEYMKELGYASQPYIIYKHEDIDRTHVHIVSCNVKANGKTINDSNLFRRSNEIRKALEKKHDLIVCTVKTQRAYAKPTPLDYRSSDLRAQVRSKALTTLSMIKFSQFDHYKAYMASLNIRVELTKAKNSGEVIGSTYQALGGRGEDKGLPMRASDIEHTGKLHINKLIDTFEKAAVEKKNKQAAFEKKLKIIYNRSVLNEKRNGEQESSDILFLKTNNRIASFIDMATGFYYDKNDLSPDMQKMISEGPTEIDKSAQVDLISQAAKSTLEIVSGIGGILSSGVGEGGTGGSTDKSIDKRKKRKRHL